MHPNISFLSREQKRYKNRLFGQPLVFSTARGFLFLAIMQNYSEKNCELIDTFYFPIERYPNEGVYLISFRIKGKKGIFWSFDADDIELPDYPFGKFKSSDIQKYKDEIDDIISDNYCFVN